MFFGGVVRAGGGAALGEDGPGDGEGGRLVVGIGRRIGSGIGIGVDSSAAELVFEAGACVAVACGSFDDGVGECVVVEEVLGAEGVDRVGAGGVLEACGEEAIVEFAFGARARGEECDGLAEARATADGLEKAGAGVVGARRAVGEGEFGEVGGGEGSELFACDEGVGELAAGTGLDAEGWCGGR